MSFVRKRALWLGFAKRDISEFFVRVPCYLQRYVVFFSWFYSDESDASYGSLRLEFSSSSSESLQIEVEREVREDPPSEHAESTWPKRGGYGWAAEGVRNCFSKYRWSRLIKSWLNSVYFFERGFDLDTMHVERVSVVRPTKFK